MLKNVQLYIYSYRCLSKEEFCSSFFYLCNFFLQFYFMHSFGLWNYMQQQFTQTPPIGGHSNRKIPHPLPLLYIFFSFQMCQFSLKNVYFILTNMHLIESVINGFDYVANKNMLGDNFNDRYPGCLARGRSRLDLRPRHTQVVKPCDDSSVAKRSATYVSATGSRR